MRPEEIHYLLAVEAVVRREGKQLDQGSGPPEPPRILSDSSGTYPDREAAEQLDPNSLWFVVYHRRLLLAAMITMVVDRHYPTHLTESIAKRLKTTLHNISASQHFSLSAT